MSVCKELYFENSTCYPYSKYPNSAALHGTVPYTKDIETNSVGHVTEKEQHSVKPALKLLCTLLAGLRNLDCF